MESELPPRTKSEVRPPYWPVWTRDTPGDWRSSSITTGAGEQVVAQDEGDRRGELLDGGGEPGRGNGDSFSEGGGFERDVAKDKIRGPAVEVA